MFNFGCSDDLSFDPVSKSNNYTEPSDYSTISTQWQRIYNKNVLANQLIQADNGAYLVSGTYYSPDGDSKTYLAKIKDNMTDPGLVWENIGLDLPFVNWPVTTTSLANGDILVIVKRFSETYSNNLHYLIKLNSEGVVSWNKELDFDFNPLAFTWESSGNVLVIGEMQGAWIAKYNQSGERITVNNFSTDTTLLRGTSLGAYFLKDIQLFSKETTVDLFISNQLFKINSNLEVESTRSIEFSGSIFRDKNSGYFIKSTYGLQMIDDLGNLLFEFQLPTKGRHNYNQLVRLEDGHIIGIGSGSGNIQGYTFKESCNTNPNCWLFCCRTLTDALIVEFDSQGKYIQQKCIVGQGEAKSLQAIQTDDGNLMYVGYMTHGQRKLWFVKFSL